MLYHAVSILLSRLLVNAQAIDAMNVDVQACLEHTTTANQMAVSFTGIFGERMSYVAMYSSFVAA